MGRGRSKAGVGANILGKGMGVPTRDDITSGNASYGGIKLVYDPGMSADASNFTTEIHISEKFFSHPKEVQRHILNHEVAHNLSDEMMFENSGRWQSFSKSFIEEKKTPESSQAYKNGQRTYWEGLYGDIGATALSETVTRAITEYLDDPTKLRQRSKRAYSEVGKYLRKRGL